MLSLSLSSWQRNWVFAWFGPTTYWCIFCWVSQMSWSHQSDLQHIPSVGRTRWDGSNAPNGICGEGRDTNSKHLVTALPPPLPFPGNLKAMSLDTFEELLIIFAKRVINDQGWLIYCIKVAASDFPQSSCSAETPAEPQQGTCLWKAEHQRLLFQNYFSLLMTV